MKKLVKPIPLCDIYFLYEERAGMKSLPVFKSKNSGIIVQTSDGVCHQIRDQTNADSFSEIQSNHGDTYAVKAAKDGNWFKTIGYPTDFDGFWEKVPSDYEIPDI
jgi:hypothetical protein